MASAEGLTRIMEVLAEAEMRMRDAASKKILVEVALLKAIEARSAVSIDTLLKQLQGLRDGQPGDAPRSPPAPAAPSSAKRPTRRVVLEEDEAPRLSATAPAPAVIPEQPAATTAPPPPDDLAE